ncbi:hypothetical protein TNCV_1958771 [Trichonephila clavipes]|nr:hypothetical protein TNCV_1958771 [Trichonephila clavipes]
MWEGESMLKGIVRVINTSKRYDCECCHVLCHITGTEKEYQEPLKWNAVRRGYHLACNNRPHDAVACQTLLR